MKFSLDDRELDALEGETVWSAARRHGVTIPHLCHKPGYAPAGNCRACMVEIEGERVLAPACCRTVREGMTVRAASERAVRAQRAVVELLNAAAPDTARLRHDSELAQWGERLGVRGSRYAGRAAPPPEDRSHPAMAV